MTARRRFPGYRSLLLGLLGCLAITAALPALANDRMDRQIRLFERAVDQALVDSPNFLVQSSEPTLGNYIEGRGMTFLFKTSLVNGEWGSHKWWKVWHDDDDDWDDEDEDDYRSSRRRSKEKSMESQEKKWRRGKQELVELIADFGEVLTTVPASESLMIEARLRKAEFFKENDLRKLKMSVGMDDVRAYADGEITEAEFTRRIKIDES